MQTPHSNDCNVKPASRRIDVGRMLCDETGADEALLQVIADAYFDAWRENDKRHIEQWPLALIVLGAIREAGYEVSKP